MRASACTPATKATLNAYQTGRVIEETGIGDPLADRDAEQPAKRASDI